MTLAEATELINSKNIATTDGQVWVDLGCGNGLFSKALINLLPTESIIYAVDQKPFSFSDQRIKFLQADFEKEGLFIPSVDGIMMFNSLHFVKDKYALIMRLKEKLLPDAGFLLGEYDMTTSNQWVPYPLTFNSAKDLFKKAGFNNVEKIGERPSSFNNTKIYSAFFY